MEEGYIGKGILISSSAVKKLLYEVDWIWAGAAAYSLALILRVEGWSKDEALEVLVNWNKENHTPLQEKAVRRAVGNAYRRTQDIPSAQWIELMAGVPVEEHLKVYLGDLPPGKPSDQVEARRKRAEGGTKGYTSWLKRKEAAGQSS